MTIPVYVVTGFLEAGKTTFLNHLLNRRDWRDDRILLVQFESGEEEFQSPLHNRHTLVFSKKSIEEQPEQIVSGIQSFLQGCDEALDEIWIEWNGMVPFSALQGLLLAPVLRGVCKIQKVIHIADVMNLERLLGRTGSALPEQIACSDLIVLRHVRTRDDLRRMRLLCRGINPGVEICKMDAYEDLYRRLLGSKEQPVSMFLVIMIMLVALYVVAAPVFDMFQIPMNTLIHVFLGIILQAVPFLLIGVLLSSAIQIFVPQSFIERHFPKSIGWGMFAAVLGGFCLPVCDCASIPIFRSLVKKGVPLPVAITFMTATPVINPVVILSTYYAFNGNMAIVIGRVCLGIIAAVLIGLAFTVWPPKGRVLSGGALDRLMCSCGCYEDAESVTTLQGKMGLFIRHSQAEFFSVGKYLLMGTFVASVFQIMGTGVFTAAQSGAGLIVSILFMMAMAFVLSLCSSSDAVVARSFATQFPIGAIMGFLVFGPMMDIKNVMMLSSGFSKRFIGQLLFAAFVVCFAVVFLFSGAGGM